MSFGMTGWKALGFKSYKEYLQSPMWIEKKLWLFKIRGAACERCRARENIQVHHTNYKHIGNEGTKDLIILCKKHHEEEHK